MPVRSRSSASATGVSAFAVAAPSPLFEGDRMICFHTSSAPDGMEAPGGGWSLLASVGDSGLRTNVWTRAATASEGSGYAITQGSGGGSIASIVALYGVSSATPRVATTSAAGSTVLITTPSVTLPSGTGVELRYACGKSASGTPIWSTPAGFESETSPGSIGGVGGKLASRDITHPGATGTVEFSANLGMSALHGVTVLLADDTSGAEPAPPVPPPTVPAIPSGEQVVHYVYEFTTLIGDDLICKDLDLADVSYDRRIGEAGTFSARCTISDTATAAKVARILPRHPEDLSTGPGRTVVHVYRNGVVWGSYVIWSASVTRQGRGPISVTLNGSTLESYLSHVKIRSDHTFNGIDQVEIARTLLTTMQSTARYDIGLQLQAGVSGVTRDRTYLASEGSTVGERIAELGTVDNGFEWAIQTIDNGDGTRSRFWVWGYPKLGSDATSHKFTEPGNVLSWQEDVDALRGGTAFQARGESINDDASTTSEPLVSPVVLAQDHLDAGWPGLDVTADYSSVSEVDTLDAYAQWWASNRAGAVRVHQATVRLPANTSFGPGNLGDSVTLMLVNDWWPVADGVASFAKSWRVVGMAFKPPSRGAGQEECVLTFEELAEG